MKKNPQKPENLNINQEEELRKNNELLKLRLRAEMGAEIGTSESIDPEIENSFLNNVLEFERQFAMKKRIVIYDFLGRPEYKKVEELTEDQLIVELKRIMNLLHKHNIGIDFLADYPDRKKYRFITEELIHEEMDDISIPGMIHQFIFEEFHPNHPHDITKRANEFIREWFSQDFSKYSIEMANQWVAENGITYSKKEVIRKFNEIFKRYKCYENTKSVILKIQPDVMEGEDCGMGYVEGTVKYDAVPEEGEVIHFEGPFKLYLKLTYGWWEIYFAHWPGLEW